MLQRPNASAFGRVFLIPTYTAHEVNLMEPTTPLPDAVAVLRGGPEAVNLSGTVAFYQKPEGVLVTARVTGLPTSNPTGFFAFHIHEGTSCVGVGFPSTGGHFNPAGTPHPNHAGDLPPLLSNGGAAYLAVLTDRFSVGGIMGRTVIIHDGPDDFRSQPAGNPGEKIACGVISPVPRL